MRSMSLTRAFIPTADLMKKGLRRSVVSVLGVARQFQPQT